MGDKMSKSKKMPEWDLSEYYKGVDDPQIDKDLALYDKKAKDFVKKYRGRVRDLDASEFLKLFKAKEEMRRISSSVNGIIILPYLSTIPMNPSSFRLTLYKPG